MPRMSKQRKQEWALFLNERNRITYNGLCRKCSSECKQSFRCVVVHPKQQKKPLERIIKDVCRHEVLGDFRTGKS